VARALLDDPTAFHPESVRPPLRWHLPWNLVRSHLRAAAATARPGPIACPAPVPPRPAHSDTAISASILLHCSDNSRANSARDKSPTTCVACAFTGSSSASRKLTATGSPPRDCGPPFSSPGSMIARCAPDWPSSHPLQAIHNCQWPNPSGPLKPRSTTGTNMKNSRHKNLTQSLHKSLNQGL
jgi:hypothetical protein